MWGSQNCIRHHQKPHNTQFHWPDSTRNGISTFYRNLAAILSHFREQDEFEMVKFEICIIKTIILPIEFFLLALEMNFSHF